MYVELNDCDQIYYAKHLEDREVFFTKNYSIRSFNI